MKKRQRKIRLIRAGIQLLFFIFAPALFSTAFAGVKSVFQAIAAHQAISWNSFLDVTAVLLVVTCLFGRHFCGYACAFGSLGDALYELTVFIRQKVFHKKRPSRILRKSHPHFAEGEIYLASGASCIYPYRLVQQASGHEPMGCVFHAHRWQTSRCCLQGGDCAADSAHDRNVHSGKIFLPVPLPNGRNFCYNAYSALCAVQP